MNRSITLSSSEIHLWLAFCDDIAADARLQSTYREMLSVTEREQEPRFYFARDRLRYLVTRALVRTVLSRYLPIEPSDWIFSANRYGRPMIANPEADGSMLSFNISHTHGLIVLGVTRQRALGVDVENIRSREVSLEIANRFFSQPEVMALAAVPLDERRDRFFEYWTFKESYIKARGMGLSLPLDKFSFHFASDSAVSISIHPELADDAARWQFWQFRPTPENLVAICAERLGDQSPRLTIRRTVPLVSEIVLASTYERTTE